MHSRMQEIKSIKKIDVLVVGSSHAYRGYDPRLFAESGYTMFNLGSSNQTPVQALALLRTYMSRLNPDLVIYDVFPGIFESDGVESSLDVIANETFNWHTIRMAFQVNHLKTYNVLVNDLFVEGLRINRGFKEPRYKSKDNDSYIQGGYVEKDKDFLRNQSSLSNLFWSPRNDQWKSFLEVEQLVDAKGAQFLMVRSPVDSSYYHRYSNQDEISERFKVVGDYIDFNDLMKLRYKEDLYDRHHLYQSGVDKFNKSLINIIKQKGFIR